MRIKGKHILVTGGTGMIGEGLVQRLVAGGAKVTTLSRRGARHPVEGVDAWKGDVTDPTTLQFKDFNAVVHGAAFVGFGLTKEKEELLMRTNVEGTRNVLEAAARDGVKKVLHISSVAAIGRTGGTPRGESWVDQRPAVFHSAYERSKYEAHRLAMARTDVPVAAIMPSIVLGLGDSSSGLILKRYLQRRIPVNVRHPGRLGWVHNTDIAEGAVLAMEKGTGPYVLSETEATLPELFERFERVTGVARPRVTLPFWALRGAAAVAEPLSHLLGRRAGVNQDFVRSMRDGTAYDASRARNELGWAPDMDRHITTDAAAFASVDGGI